MEVAGWTSGEPKGHRERPARPAHVRAQGHSLRGLVRAEDLQRVEHDGDRTGRRRACRATEVETGSGAANSDLDPGAPQITGGVEDGPWEQVWGDVLWQPEVPAMLRSGGRVEDERVGAVALDRGPQSHPQPAGAG